jgi:hypothetical protein
MKENLDDPVLVEGICMRGEEWQRFPCISGMTGLYVNHYGAVDPARQMCDLLQPENRFQRLGRVRGLEGMF